jgi:preprotein translocase subunit SecA
MMYGRRYSEGLHQAIEAKEGVKIQQESRTLATITFQNLFRLYTFLSGMTGTAKTEEEEFFKIYQLQVETIPTHKQMVRQDLPDAVFKTETAKFDAIAKEITARHKQGQPMLIGTVSIAKNELLADVLKKNGLKFELLNAKNHEREAHIIAQAGRLGAITLATNIAGRGVDIFLGGNPVDEAEAEAVKQAGGLHIIGTERHESRRIDNQLRGRAGRQGDAGSSQFYVSMEDDLMRLFGGERMKSLMTTLGLPDDQPIEAKLVSRSIESAQKRIEGLNFDTRKHVLEFDDVLNHQRNTIYTKRKNFVAGTKQQTEFHIAEELFQLIEKELDDLIQSHFATSEDKTDKNLDELIKAITGFMPVTLELQTEIKKYADNPELIIQTINAECKKIWASRIQEMGEEGFLGALRFVALQAIDSLWMEHLDTMDHLRDSVRLRGYGQRDPLVEYKKEGHLLFKNLLAEIDKQIVYTIFRVSIKTNEQLKPQENLRALQTADSTVGRNDPCPCGSGKKWKKCGMIGAKEHGVSSKL